MSKSDEINARLEAAFAPEHLEVINESEGHKGHAGYSDGETHYRIVIKALAFENMGRLARHRAVHAALGDDLMGRIHALALEIS
ncbi:MAG TPA: BolA family transcriptional regulator [Aliiroseovarius sp.]|nr:BolA family transcriptional regulator [Aliiroseovarius sp.]